MDESGHRAAGPQIKIVGDPKEIAAKLTANLGRLPKGRPLATVRPLDIERIERTQRQTAEFAAAQRELRQAQIETRDLLRSLASGQRWASWLNLVLLVATLALLSLTVVLVLR